MGGCLDTDKGGADIDGDHAVEVFETVGVDCAPGKNARIADEDVERAEDFCCFGHSGAELFGGSAIGFDGQSFASSGFDFVYKFQGLSSELEKVNATDAPSEASRRTMPAPMPFEPLVTRATLPVNDFSCTAAMNILQSSPTPVLDDSVQNKIRQLLMDVGAKIMLTGDVSPQGRSLPPVMSGCRTDGRHWEVNFWLARENEAARAADAAAW